MEAGYIYQCFAEATSSLIHEGTLVDILETLVQVCATTDAREFILGPGEGSDTV